MKPNRFLLLLLKQFDAFLVIASRPLVKVTDILLVCVTYMYYRSANVHLISQFKLQATLVCGNKSELSISQSVIRNFDL